MCIGIPDSTSVFTVWSDITFNIVIVQSIEQAKNSFSLSTDEGCVVGPREV